MKPPRLAVPGLKIPPFQLFMTLVLGTLGGALFHALNTPLPWMLGSMAVVALVAISGIKVRGYVPSMPRTLRSVMITILGVMLGSYFTPDVVQDAVQWTPSIAGLFIYAAAAGLSGAYYFARVMGYGPVTSYFSATPGGFSEMVIIGQALGGDDRIISVVHTVRITIVVFALPFWFRIAEGYGGVPDLDLTAKAPLGAIDALWLLGCAVAGPFVGKALRLPAAFLMGSLLLSVIVHMTGLTQSQPPQVLVNAAQVVIGANIGCRFVGINLRSMGGVMVAAVGFTVLLLGLATGFAVLLSHWTGLPFAAILLAFSPGGLAEMCLISLAMGIDVAFVSTHHLVRIVVTMLLAPIAFRMVYKATKGGGGGGGSA